MAAAIIATIVARLGHSELLGRFVVVQFIDLSTGEYLLTLTDFPINLY